MRKLFIAFFVLVGICSCSAAQHQGVQVPQSYKECVAMGYPVVRTYPGQCITPEGKRFVQEGEKPFAAPLPPLRDLSPSGEVKNKICVDKCGDGICQEIVCMGSGCPCSENTQRCPKDCAS